MVTECYIKGRFDFGVGKCAIVVVEGGEIVSQQSWVVPSTWNYNGKTVDADQFNCEILAATYALKWCIENNKKLVNIYTNTTSCQKWYFRGEFPDARKVMGNAYLEMMDTLQHKIDEEEGQQIREVVFADYIPKSSRNEFNQLVNELAFNAK